MRNVCLGVVALAALAVSGVANAQNGHFFDSGPNAPTCTVVGLTLVCTGKVAGLASTGTFRVEVQADISVIGDCINPTSKRPPGQAQQDLTAPGTTGDQQTPQSGQAVFSVPVAVPSGLNPCPNPNKWSFEPTSVIFTSAVLSLFEGNLLVDTFTIP